MTERSKVLRKLPVLSRIQIKDRQRKRDREQRLRDAGGTDAS
jgi:hypothetical protein